MLHYLSNNGSLALKAAIPGDKLIPCLGGYKNIVQLIYKVLLQGLCFLVLTKNSIMALV